jgi:hypothetical protein
MKRSVITICLAVICLSVILSSGCAAPGQPKGVHQVIGEGIANTGLFAYDLGAMSVNMVWGIGTLGYGLEDGHTLLPLYHSGSGKFEAQKF